MFLTPDELLQLTGYRQRAAQIRWLRRNRVRFYLQGITEKPVVTKAEVERIRESGKHQGPRTDWIDAA